MERRTVAKLSARLQASKRVRMDIRAIRRREYWAGDLPPEKAGPPPKGPMAGFHGKGETAGEKGGAESVGSAGSPESEKAKASSP